MQITVLTINISTTPRRLVSFLNKLALPMITIDKHFSYNSQKCIFKIKAILSPEVFMQLC